MFTYQDAIIIGIHVVPCQNNNNNNNNNSRINNSSFQKPSKGETWINGDASKCHRHIQLSRISLCTLSWACANGLDTERHGLYFSRVPNARVENDPLDNGETHAHTHTLSFYIYGGVWMPLSDRLDHISSRYLHLPAIGVSQCGHIIAKQSDSRRTTTIHHQNLAIALAF